MAYSVTCLVLVLPSRALNFIHRSFFFHLTKD